jgi:hypothetical protein
MPNQLFSSNLTGRSSVFICNPEKNIYFVSLLANRNLSSISIVFHTSIFILLSLSISGNPILISHLI